MCFVAVFSIPAVSLLVGRSLMLHVCEGFVGCV